MANAQRWLKIVIYGESGIVIQLQDDCEYRITEILKDKKILKEVLGPYYRKYLLGCVPADSGIEDSLHRKLREISLQRGVKIPNSLTTLQELVEFLVNKGFNIGLFVTGIGELSYESLYDELRKVEVLLENSHNISVLAFSDKDISREKYSQLVDKCSLLYDHIEIYPLYGRDDSNQFLHYNESMWNMNLSDALNEEIVYQCGGYLWLISHVQRQFRDNPKLTIEDMASDMGLLIKLESILNKLNAEEREILRSVEAGTLGRVQADNANVRFLKKVRLIVEESDNLVLGVPLMRFAIKRSFSLAEVRTQTGKIYVGETEVTHELSDSEIKILRFMIEHKSTIISREDIAISLWGSQWESKFSDWALDRMMSRLRRKVKMVGIDPNLIRTIKGKGFVFG